MAKRVFIIVLDSMGVGAMPDAYRWGDEGSDTLGHIRTHPNFDCPNLKKLGLFNIAGVGGGADHPAGAFCRMSEASNGKDTTTGHWEIAGLISESPFPTYPDGFPDDVVKAIEKLTGRGVLCNKPYSGTEVIKDYGGKHMKTGDLIVYTSADSVLQIAAHEDVIPVPELYRICEDVRELMTGRHAVGRIIARPFEGEWPYRRTPRRHDFSLRPPKTTVIDRLEEAGLDRISVGKIYDIFAGKGFSESECNRTVSNADGMAKTMEIASRNFRGLCFVNLVDFDSSYGHRNDVAGYAAAMTEFDRWLGDFLPKLRRDDLLIITADHGCDPSTASTDHSREYTPMVCFGASVRAGVDLGTRSTFADIGATVLEALGVGQGDTAGTSFLGQIVAPVSDGDLMKAAAAARGGSYSPYSRFSVGAALLGRSGRVYTGCNIENAAFTPSVCAERVALFKAVSEGERDFDAIAVCGGGGVRPAAMCPPCGVCRQALAEFCGPDFRVILGRPGKPVAYRLGELLPEAFTPKNL
jgi:phosphopentomutase